MTPPFREWHLAVPGWLPLVAQFEFNSAVNMQGKWKLSAVPNDLLTWHWRVTAGDRQQSESWLRAGTRRLTDIDVTFVLGLEFGGKFSQEPLKVCNWIMQDKYQLNASFNQGTTSAGKCAGFLQQLQMSCFNISFVDVVSNQNSSWSWKVESSTRHTEFKNYYNHVDLNLFMYKFVKLFCLISFYGQFYCVFALWEQVGQEQEGVTNYITAK